jgi:hypothetical protein
MELNELHDTLRYNGYSFKVENDITTITHYSSVYLRYIERLPENVIFKNSGNVEIPKVNEIPQSVIFENKGNVIMKDDIKINRSYTGFKNIGYISPENFKLKTPPLKYMISDDFYCFLSENIKNKYIAKLINMQNFNIPSDGFQVSCIDSNDEESISFLPTKQIIKKYTSLPDDERKRFKNIEGYLTSKKNELFHESLKFKVKIGRFLKKTFPEITDAEVEDFVNLYKSYRANNNYEMLIVYGDDIVKYYNRANQDTGTGTILYNSCMNHIDPTEAKARQVQFYAKNENCGLLILRLKGSDKIRGRGFIWTCTNGKKFVDRNYTVKASEANYYNKFAAQNGCLIKGVDSIDSLIINCSDGLDKLQDYPPYLDTFKYYKNENLIRGNHYYTK